MRKKLALVFGALFLAIGILGFVPATFSGGLLFGVFAVDLVHNIVHIISGTFAFAARRKGRRMLRSYFKVLGVAYFGIALIGIAQGGTILKLMLTNPAMNGLHLAVALVALWAGFGLREQ